MIHLGIKIEKETKDRLAEIAKINDRSISSVVRISIEKGLGFFERGVSHPKPKKRAKGVCHPNK
tara:strand:+ start:1296 stop:1487 length:192 start_codon:yes stop_codon:yes gene_type:complete